MSSRLGSKCPRTRRCVYAECRAAEKAQRKSERLDEAGTRRDQSRDVPEGECGCGDAKQDEAGRLLADDRTTNGLKTGADYEYAMPDTAPIARRDRKLPGDVNFIGKPSQSHNENDESSTGGTDKTTKPPYSWGDMVWSVISIATYLADIGTDLFLVYLYYTHQKWWYFGLTLGFIVVPGLTVTTFSLAWYIEDHKQAKSEGEADPKRPVHPAHWVSRFMLLVLQLAPVMRYIETLIYGWWSKKADEEKDKTKWELWYQMMLYEGTDSSLLRLIECFMESAPQLVLQLYILTTYGKQIGSDGSTILGIGQAVSCVASLSSMSWALATYHKALRRSQENKALMSYKGMAMLFFWRFFTIGPRVLALALFASTFGWAVFVAVGVHWIAMFLWILFLSTSFCNTKGQEIFFNAVMAAVYIFCYLNLKEGHTRLRYFFFSSLVYLQNVSLLLCWYFFGNTDESWRVILFMVVILLGFFIGIFFQCLYYLLCHPNNFPPWDKKAKIKVWIPLSVLRPTLFNLSLNQPKLNTRQKRRASLASIQELEELSQASPQTELKEDDHPASTEMV